MRMEDYVTVAEAAAALKVSDETIQRWCRRKRGDGRVEDELPAKQPDPIAVWNRVDALKAERDRYPEATAALERANADQAAAAAKLDELHAALPKLAARKEELANRKEIFRADVELDQVVSVYKLGFVLLCELALREYFAGTRMHVLSDNSYAAA